MTTIMDPSGTGIILVTIIIILVIAFFWITAPQRKKKNSKDIPPWHRDLLRTWLRARRRRHK